MQIYRIGSSEEGDSVGLEREDDWDAILDLTSDPVADTWTPLLATLYNEDSRGHRPLVGSRMPSLHLGMLVLRDAAIDTVGPLMEPFGELLPLSCADARLALVHITRVLDALDENRSEIARVPETGSIITISRYAFSPNVINRGTAFVLPQWTGDSFFTDDLVRSIDSYEFGGTEFESVGDTIPVEG